MHASVYDFVTRVLGPDQVRDKRVLEVGALDVNGSVRPYVTSLKPAEYIGTDRRKGRRVDRVVNAENLTKVFGYRRFDVVLCLEALEHMHHWRTCFYNMLQVLTTDGLLVLTSRSPGFPYHDHPDDHWRWKRAEWEEMLSHCSGVTLEDDPEAPGFFLACYPMGPTPMYYLDRIHAVPAPRPAP
jgi:SAM-dependent methyltransferase